MSSEEKTTNVIQRYAQPIGLQLTKGAWGAYRWTIDIKAESADEALTLAKQMDLELSRTFAAAGSTQPTAEKPAPATPQDPHSKMDQALHNIKDAGEKLTASEGGEKA